MNKTELVEVISSKAEITKAEAGKVLGAALDGIIEGLAKDGKVTLVGGNCRRGVALQDSG